MSDYNVVSGSIQIPFQNKANTNLMFKYSINIPIEIEYLSGGPDELEIISTIYLNDSDNTILDDSKTIYFDIENNIIQYEHNIKVTSINDDNELLLYFEFPDNIKLDDVYMDIESGFGGKPFTNNILYIGTIKDVYDGVNNSERLRIGLVIDGGGYHYH